MAIDGCTGLEVSLGLFGNNLDYLTFCLRRWHSVQDAAGRVDFPAFLPTILTNSEKPGTLVWCEIWKCRV